MHKDTAHQSKPLRIAQITDTHIYSDPQGQLLGLNTKYCLEQVIELALRDQPFDMVVASGDLSHDASIEAYAMVCTCFKRMALPVYCLPGNHDEALVLRQNLNNSHFHSVKNTVLGDWHLVFLDTTLAGSEGGHLSDAELAALEQALADHPQTHTIVFMHHQPVNVGSQWLDTMAIDNPDALFEIIDRNPQVQALVCGHVHQTFDGQRQDVRLLATPSTCIQFLPGSRDFAVEEIPPGFRWLELYTDGAIKTGVTRLPAIPGKLDFSARGY